uniref:Uncharacterized protein n=1 Tax=Morchella importuna TaxID=1174673 RepID=A0A650AFB9_9PEZI|nr:hypothetical protein [Morchella importuna]QGN66735.1 hypothetical protein [Morchella importuna]
MALSPLSKSFLRDNTKWSSWSRNIFDRIGLMMDPWGVPMMLLLKIWKSKYPAVRAFQINFVKLLSVILSSISFMSLSWGMESKHLDMSPSINHCAGWNSWLTLFSAVWQLRFGRNPCEQSLNKGSKIASSINLMASWTILSIGAAMVKGRVPPDGLPIPILLLGANLNFSLLSRAESCSNFSLEIPSRVSGETPGGIFPGLLFMFS